MNKEAAFIRFHQALDYLINNKFIIKQLDIAESLNMKETAVSSALKNKDRRFTEGFLRRFASAYSDYINEGWLVDGVGFMVKPSNEIRPYISVGISAGFSGPLSQSVAEYEGEFRTYLPEVGDYDFSAPVKGESMLPELRDGDTIYCRWIENLSQIKEGEIYVIDSKEEAVVKQIAEASREGITVHSINPLFHDYFISGSNILRIAKVVGALRHF